MTVENGFTPSAGGGTVEVYGEDGDDTIQGNQDGETQQHTDLFISGGDGNDKITGFDGASGTYRAAGNAGNDKIILGENHNAVYGFGGDGNDYIYGAANSASV